jgi:hypothetical protein
MGDGKQAKGLTDIVSCFFALPLGNASAQASVPEGIINMETLPENLAAVLCRGFNLVSIKLVDGARPIRGHDPRPDIARQTFGKIRGESSVPRNKCVVPHIVSGAITGGRVGEITSRMEGSELRLER